MAKPLASLFALRAAVTGTGLTAAGSAWAAPALMLNVMVNPIAASAAIDIGCAASEKRVSATKLALPASQIVDKSSAILGGEMSALDRIRMQQGAAAAPSVASRIAVPAQPRTLAPAAAGGLRKISQGCGNALSAVSASPRTTPFESAPTGDFLASKRVRIGKTTFDSDWRRVARENLSGVANRSVGATSRSLQTVESVNRWVNREIRYVEDRDLFGRADYWAGAKVTLSMRKGDCEDIALTKMQMLADAGFDRGDLFLTIARDKARNLDHALLIVKVEGRFVILDNATDQLLDGAYAHDYAPVLSFSEKNKWVHGI